MERFTAIKETCFSVINSQRREELSKWCQVNAVSGYQTVKTLVTTILGKLRPILDASVLGQAFANSKYLRLFGVSALFAIGISWLVGGAVQVVNTRRRKEERQTTNTEKVKATKKQASSSRKVSPPNKKLGNATTGSDRVNIVVAGNKFRAPHPVVTIVLSGIVAVAFMASRCVARSQKKKPTTATAGTKN